MIRRFYQSHRNAIEKFDQFLLNNPVLERGLVIAPVIVTCNTLANALALSVAFAFITVLSILLTFFLPRKIPYTIRVIANAMVAALLFIPAAMLLERRFPESIFNLGIYLPLLVVEPLLTYRFGRVQETLHKAVSKGLRITVGYALLLMLLGCVREWLALGTVFGTPVGQRAVLPMAGMPAGGFIVLGVLCAVWRALAARRKAYLVREARSLVDVHAQKEADGEQ